MLTENFYNTYNARHLAPKEVAEKFIWSDSFGKLIQNNHSIILGARGCGKTTLMKMLTIPALHTWENDKRAENIKRNIPFYGIYISTDIYWNVKNQAYGKQLEAYSGFSDVVSRFAVNSNVFTSLCDTFLNIINIQLCDNDEEKEVELCKYLIKAWKLDPVVPKIKFIKEALNERIDYVNQFIQEIIFNFSPVDKIDYPDFFNLNFESSLEQLIPKFERIYSIQDEKKWALCFDELEFAPPWLQKQLFTSLRSRKEFILYKLSASPILASDLEKYLTQEYSATPGNDVQLIKMWASGDTETFSLKIIKSFLDSEINLQSFFGSNPIYNGSSDSYTENSEFYKELLSLIGKDDSFKDFLESKGVNVSHPVPTSPEQKDRLYRKIKPIVYYRNALIESNKRGKKLSLRSRKKVIDLFSGIEVLQKICDGNPRWLIGIIREIISSSDNSENIEKIQYNELLKAAKRFMNVMANIPVDNNEITIVDFIDRIGNFYKHQVLGSDFVMDPKSTFVVDESEVALPSNIINLLEIGLSQGAFILLDSSDDRFDFEVRGQRFKLSFLFSILYILPLRKYNKVKLSDCLKMSGGDSDFNQFSLFE